MPSCVETGDVQVFPKYGGGRDAFERDFSAKEKTKIGKDVEKIKKLPKPCSWSGEAYVHNEEDALEYLKDALKPSHNMLIGSNIYFTRIEVSRKGRGKFDYEVSVRKTDEGSHLSSPIVTLFYHSKDL
jgi:hypothetical protein